LEVREIIEFRLKKGAYENVIAWIDESLQNNELVLTEGNSEFIELPNLYRNSVYGEKIIIEMKDNELSIFFPIGDGLFEYFPGFMYRSMGSAPPKGALYPELECKIHQTPNWYLCH
jgi:hypothetical protein